MEFWNNLDNTVKTYIIWVGGFMVLYLVAMVIYLKNKKKSNQKWLAQNPTAVKMFLSAKSDLIHSNGLRIISVDGAAPVYFYEGTKQGIYVLPGNRLVESTFSTTRPGILHKTVTTEYGPTKQELEIEAGKTYNYSFDLKEERYELEEI